VSLPLSGTCLRGDTHKPAEWYADFLDDLPVGIYRTTLEGKLVFCNRALAQVFGFTVEELIDYPVVNLYRKKKDRGGLIQAIIERGRVVDLPLSCRKKDGTPIWCTVTARPVFDDDGMLVLIDGILREITGSIQEKEGEATLDNMVDHITDLVILLDLQGNVIDINNAGTELFGFQKNRLTGKPLFDFVVPRHKELFPLFLSDILKTGREEGILTILDRKSKENHIEFSALLVKKRGKAHHIRAIARNVTERIRQQRELLNHQKFQGVLEMAGGVAHRLNQPLTVINHILPELMSSLNSNDINYGRIVRIQDQIEKLNDISKKIGTIKKYEAMDYVAGIRIVDIDKAS
jgi:PAS domain S-box-containing protein